MAQTTQPGAKGSRTYVSGYFLLELDGMKAGILNAVDGGHFKSEAIGEQVGGDNLVTRYPGRQKFEDITLTLGPNMSGDFWKWVKQSVDYSPTRRNGAIVARDYDNLERSRRTFADALIAEVQFPALDAASKSSQQITVKIAPETIAFAPGSGKKDETPPPRVDPQKRFSPSNFRLTLDGIDPLMTQQVSKIDAFSIKQNILNAPVGGLLYAPREAGRVEFPTLSLYTAESHAQPWLDWWKAFVGDGNHVGAKERSGSIAFLDPSMKTELLLLELTGVGITGITFDKLEAGAEKIRQVKVDLYVERISFTPPKQ